MKIRAALACAGLLLASCGDDDTAAVDGTTPSVSSTVDDTSAPVTITLLAHDSFSISESTLEAFTAETGIEVELLLAGDAGSTVNQAILSKDDPQADVLFGIDNTFLSRALAEDLFVAYESPALAGVDERLVLDDQHRVTPIDFGNVCLNYDIDALAAADLEPPTTLDDLIDDAYAGSLVVENPATSSPGLAFLLATIAEYGEDGWVDYWRQLRDNDVDVVDGWEEAYYGSFTRGGGDRPLVVSYATSPPAEVIFAEEELDEAPTGVVEASCYEQIEFAGILVNGDHEAEAQDLIDFMLSETFQADIPLNMFVYPVIDVELPQAFVDHGVVPADPYALDPADIDAHRDDWIETWTDVVLR